MIANNYRPSLLFLIFCFLLISPIVTGQEGEEEEEKSPAVFAVTAGEKEQLLNRTEELLKWIRTLDVPSRRNVPLNQFRAKIQPLELMQAAAILKQKNQPDLARMAREILPYLQPTPLECFEIAERLGDTVLDSFQEEKELLSGDAPDSTTRIKDGAAQFLKNDLTPAEKMALYREPENATEIMKVVDVLAVAGRPVLIRYYLRKLLATPTEPEEFARIAEQLGSRKLLSIANHPEFAPQGREAVVKIFEEAKKYWQDEKTVAQSLEEWQDLEKTTSPNQKTTYSPPLKPLRALWKGNNVSLAQLLEKLGSTQNENEIDELLAVILSFSTEGRESLAVCLRSDNAVLVANSARGLASSIHADELFLLFPTLFATSPISEEQRHQVLQLLQKRHLKIPNSEDASAILLARANDYFEKNRSLKPGFDGYVRFWNWDEKEKKPNYIQMLLPAAYRSFAFRYADHAYRIKPEIQEIRRLYLAAFFEQTAYNNGRDAPFDLEALGVNEFVRKVEPEPKQQQILLEQVLRDSLSKEHFAAAQVSAMLLGGLGDVKSLLLRGSSDGKPGLLVQAVIAKDRRVRFAALEAVMRLQPAEPYPGSSFVSESLIWFSRADGQRVLISAHPKQSSAARTAGYFIGCGYDGELATTCRSAMQLAAETPDTELLVVDMLTSEPPVRDLVQEMRNDARTADIPAAVLSNDATLLESAPNIQNRPTMQKIDRLIPNAPFSVSLSQIYPRLINDEGAKWINDDLFEKTGIEPVLPAVRLEQARKALGWIKTVIENAQEGRKIYHFEELEDAVYRALRSEVRVVQGLELAAVIRSAAVQAALYEVAANSVYPPELREKAATFFGKSLDSFGVLLRGQQIQRLYDRYNASEFEPKETQELLGKLIDLVEERVREK
jgi:hypothetical protein